MKNNNWINSIARIGLVSKGIVYLLLGLLAFMAAFEIGGQQGAGTTQKNVFDFVKKAPGGMGLLALLCAGLFCYSLWRGIQAFGRELKWTKRLRYLFSGLAYLSAAYTALRIVLHTYRNNGNQNQHLAGQILQTTYGKWLLGALALVVAATGIYQIWYGLSEKYKKHVQGLGAEAPGSYLLYSGKIGYAARGTVWLIVSYLLLKAALHANAAEAGGSGKALRFIEQVHYGSILLGAIGFGLMAYGLFNFIRARYEPFRS
jgi:hypothetical protein